MCTHSGLYQPSKRIAATVQYLFKGNQMLLNTVTFPDIIKDALVASETGVLILSEIYSNIECNYPKITEGCKGWKASIRKELKASFMKQENQWSTVWGCLLLFSKDPLGRRCPLQQCKKQLGMLARNTSDFKVPGKVKFPHCMCAVSAKCHDEIL